MSGENVKLMRSIYAISERGELGYELWANPEIEYLDGDGTVDDGKIRRLEEYFDRTEALKAVGLEE